MHLTEVFRRPLAAVRTAILRRETEGSSKTLHSYDGMGGTQWCAISNRENAAQWPYFSHHHSPLMYHSHYHPDSGQDDRATPRVVSLHSLVVVSTAFTLAIVVHKAMNTMYYPHDSEYLEMPSIRQQNGYKYNNYYNSGHNFKSNQRMDGYGTKKRAPNNNNSLGKGDPSLWEHNRDGGTSQMKSIQNAKQQQRPAGVAMSNAAKGTNSDAKNIFVLPTHFVGVGSYGGNSLKPKLIPENNGRNLREDESIQAFGPLNPDLPGYKMVWDPRIGKDGDYNVPGDLPVFWEIPFSGSSVILDVMRSCHRLTTTTTGEQGVVLINLDTNRHLSLISPGTNTPQGYDRITYVNVDTTTLSGLLRAKQLNLSSSGLADVVITPFIYESDSLFTPNSPGRKQGRLFAIFRDPIQRAVDMFYYMKFATWEPSYNPELMNMSIDQYAKSDLVENNWMTRHLSQNLDGELTQDHLTIALEVLRTRILVGLDTHLNESLDRFEKYFLWKYKIDPKNQEHCRNRFVSKGGFVNPNPKKKVLEQGTEAYEAIFWQNQFDLEIYAYAEGLFSEQGEFVGGIPDSYRTLDTTCCKCNPPTYPPDADFVCRR